MSQFLEYRAWKGWSEETFGRIDPVQARYFEAEFKAAGATPSGVLSLLEIGFGNAELAVWAQRQGWNWVGTELDPALVTRARDAGFAAHEASRPIQAITPPGGFDMIVAFDVLEHLTLSEIAAFLTSVRASLKPTGRFIARFPSGDSPFAGAIQHGDVTHKTAIGSGMVEQLAQAAGLDLLRIAAPVFPLTGVGWRRTCRRLPIVLGRIVIGRLLRLFYFDNQPRVVDPNMVVVLQPSIA